MKKLKRISILLLTMGALITTTSCDLFTSKSNTNTPSDNDNSDNIDTGTNTDQGNTTTPDSGNNNQNQDNGNTGSNTTPSVQTYTVTFNTNGGSSISNQNVESGKTISSVTTTKTGCTFGGWYTDSALTKSFSTSTPITGAITLYAKWRATVTFNINNGSAITAQTVDCGSTITEVTTSRNGYDFAGWYTDASFNNSFNTTTPIETSITLYAKWTLKSTPGNILNDYAAYNEGAYVVFEASSAAAASNSIVSYSTDNINWTNIDSQLIRYDNTSKTARADILGLKAGNYTIKVNNTEKESTTATINVSADDRSGYAHFNYTDGVGAYKDDGTLKDNAVVVYVSDSNKNTVTAKIGSSTYTGLVNIINNANSSYPLDIRILDDVKTCQFNKITYKSSPLTTALLAEQANSIGGNYSSYSASTIISNGWNSYSDDLNAGITELKGLSSSMSYGGNSHNKDVYTDAFDTNWNMCKISSKSNITIEGIGEDAGIFQWGFSLSSCNNIEIKNLRFHNYTEDAIGIEGGSRFWLHNNTFDIGVNNWDFSDEQDKGDGDGATDYKKASNLTISYCRYNNTHKTNLIGGDNKHLQSNVTLHHNFYNNCSSRLPLGRQANMHFYNNYYYKCSTCQDIRANAFVLSEFNYFDNCSACQKVTVDSTYTGTVIKSYNDYMTGGSSAATKVTSRAETLSGNCKPDGSTDYTNFDTNKSLFYYDDTNNISKVDLMLQASDVKSYVPLVAGAGTLVALDYTMNYTETNTGYVDTTTTTATYNASTNAPSSAGLYYTVLDSSSSPLTEANVTSSTVVKEKDGKITITDTNSEATTIGYYMFEDSKRYTTGTHTYTINVTLGNVGGNWAFIRLLDANGSEFMTIGAAASNKYMCYTYKDTTQNTVKQTAFAANKSYTISLSINYDTNTASLTIDGTTVNISSFDTASISGIKFFTAKAATDRSFTVNSITIA